jgi:hypothetical protein
MTAPNLKNPTTITGKTARTGITTTTVVGILTNSAASNKVLKINSIFAANVNGTTASDISVSIYNGSSDSYLAYTISVPPDATQIISTKETYFYLEEGDSIRAIAGTSSAINLVVGYEEIS